jgi:predicted signal transduction protein with EAL and GGDEF domain
MAHALEMTVIGEGVENRDQLAILRLLGCDLGQGNFLAPPLTAAALARRARSGPGAGNGTVPVSVEAMSDPLVTDDRRTGVPELAPPLVREK